MLSVPIAPAQQPATPKRQELKVESVISRVQAGLSDEIIIARLRKEDRAFDLTTEDMIRLKKANVSDPVLRIMMDPKAETKAAAAPSPSSAAAMVQAPSVASIIGSSPSGATPAAGAGVSGDPNNPMTPHDSGIYLYTKDRAGQPLMTVLERAAYQGAKTGGLFATALTYGIKKAKTKAVIPGPRASIRVGDPALVFYFYFEDKAAGLGRSYFGISNLSNPNQFALLKLETAKSNRETVIGQFSAFSVSSGTDAKSMIAFKSERIRPGLYKVNVDGLRAGEYCFLASSGALGAYGAGAAGAADIFDFGVDPNQ
jgi:hypothetical protein